MKIVINSHIKNDIALQHLLDSMKILPEFNNFEHFIIIGGYYHINNYEITKNKNLVYIKCNHNSIDFTGLITLLELKFNEIDYYFYMHDTCKVGNRFYKILNSIDLTNITTIKINKKCSMNIGIYSQKIINEFKDFLLSKKNTSSDKLMEFKSINYNEDYIFENDKSNKILDNFNLKKIKQKPVNYYNTGTMRIVEYYSNIDLYKIKANWGQGKWFLNN